LRGRSCSSQQIPEISEKFESYNLFASALLTDVYGEENLSNALHYSATQFASLYIENQGGGKFKTHLLPNNAQISSVNDILIRDFDGDKITDILLAGNLFTSEIETTRNDAGVGLFLKGDGKGNFKPISPFKSNLLLPFDVKKLGLINTPKGNYLIAAVNDGKLVSYKLK